MLVLTRKVGEGIAIGDDVKVIVMQIKGKQVRLGIKASPSTIVHREEIFQKIQDENRLAAESSPSQDALSQYDGLLAKNRSQADDKPLNPQVRPSSQKDKDNK